jgi:hypothetical protein
MDLSRYISKRGQYLSATIVLVLMMLPKIVLQNIFFQRLTGYFSTFSTILCCCTIKRQLIVKKVLINNGQNSKKKSTEGQFWEASKQPAQL